MRIITVVGSHKSGKTSTIVSLIEAIRRRGKKAGTCRSEAAPTFSVGKFNQSAACHRRAGSELTCIRAQGETAFLYPEELPLSQVLERFRECAYVFLEGDYVAPVPRLVCAHHEEDALIRMSRRTLAFAGRISEIDGIELPLPSFNALTDADKLLDYIDSKIPDIMPCSLLDQKLPPSSCMNDDDFSVTNGNSHREDNADDTLQVIFGGKHIALTAAQRSVLLNWIHED